MAGDHTTPVEAEGSDGGDPRLRSEYVRVIDDVPAADAPDRGSIALVGVVHDHPASVFRVRRLLAAREPDVLALELPPLAVPLFERYADDGATPPARGGEMSAAIQAADADRTAGIDGPTPAFALRLAGHLIVERPSASTVRTAIDRFARASGHAVRCRLAALLANVFGYDPTLSAPREHAVASDDPAAEQARDERRQVRLARSVAAAFGGDRAVATRDETREAHMARRLAALTAAGDVVAVIGVDHVGPVAEHLEACGAESRTAGRRAAD